MRLNVESLTLKMYSGPADDSGNDGSCSMRSTSTSTLNSCSIHSTSTSARNARLKARRIKGIGVENKTIADNICHDENARFKTKTSGTQSRTEEIPAAPTIMDALADEIESMELEYQKLLEEFESAKREKEERLRATRRKQEGDNQDFLFGRITELEVENKILKTRLQSGNTTVDSIRSDIASMVTSNQEVKNALKEAKSTATSLQNEQERIRSKLQQAETDLKALEPKASFKRTTRSLRENQKAVFEQAAREILDLQKTRGLKQQRSQRKLQKSKAFLQDSAIQQYLQKQGKQPTPTKPKRKQPRKSITRQNSWWQLDGPEAAPKRSVRALDGTPTPEKIPKRLVRSLGLDASAINTTESEDSDIDTL